MAREDYSDEEREADAELHAARIQVLRELAKGPVWYADGWPTAWLDAFAAHGWATKMRQDGGSLYAITARGQAELMNAEADGEAS